MGTKTAAGILPGVLREMPALSVVSRQTNSGADDRPEFFATASALLASCGVPELYRRWRLWDFPEQNEPAWDRGGVLVKGPTGTGKSCFAAALLRSRMKPGHGKTLATATPESRIARYEIAKESAMWYRCGEILFDARGAFRDGGRSESEIIAECVVPKLLVLDDLSAGRMTDTGWTIIAEIVARRVDAMRDTIVTTNLTLEEIHLQEPRLASRLGAFEEVAMNGKDRRLS